MTLFHLPLVVGVLLGFCWWASRGRRTGLVASVVAGLGTGLGLGLWLMPTNVHVAGTVTDALTGRPLTNATLRLLRPQPAETSGAEDRPNARTDRQGRFHLYVGWYSPGKPVIIGAPGYESVSRPLGPRPSGARRLTRDFQLKAAQQPAPNRSPVPGSGQRTSPVVPR